jgi:hypothetical protein
MQIDAYYGRSSIIARAETHSHLAPDFGIPLSVRGIVHRIFCMNRVINEAIRAFRRRLRSLR